ncbi:MAG: OmpA family protein [Bacteroidota bacterium]
MNAIINKGVDKSRLSATGWGQAKPIADNKTEDGRAKNRRAEIVKK